MAISKDFSGWAEYQAFLQRKTKLPYFYEREIWWAAIGHNLGSEEDGKGRKYARPVLMIRKFNQYLFWGIPLSTKRRKGKYYADVHYKLKLDTALLSQLRAFDSKRLIKRAGKIDDLNFTQVQLGLFAILKKHPQK